jgi:hypothetical protein
VVAFYEVEVWILHFFKLVGVGLRQRQPPAGATAGGGSRERSESGSAWESMTYEQSDRMVDNLT